MNTKNILLINGPNLNLLGKREPEIYGSTTLADIESQFISNSTDLGLNPKTFQSNIEGEIINFIHDNPADMIIINPAALGHTSIALRDALLGVNIPFIEVHLSNPHSREEFRKKSYLSDIATGVIAGFRSNSYSLALQVAHKMLNNN